MKKIVPIAMLCNQEQFEDIRPKLEELGIISSLIGAFKEYRYLTNNFNDDIKNKFEFDFISNDVSWEYAHKNNIHETWNERIFLEACGIETQETFEITKETIIKYKMKDEFPEVFEAKLEVGKWYKKPNTPFVYHILEIKDKNNIKAYGFDLTGEYSNTNNFDWGIPKDLVEATEQEVFEVLKNEAVKRGFVGKDIYIEIGGRQYCLESEIGKLQLASNLFFYQGANIFDNGKWAKILETKTKEEAEKLLNCKIV